MNNVNNYYLSKMGIQSWSLRKLKQFPDAFAYSLLKNKRFIGYLVLQSKFENFQVSSKVIEIINAMLKAIGLELSDDLIPLNVDNPQTLSNSELLIAMGSFGSDTFKDLSNSKVALVCDPNELLLSPLRKKDVWQKLRIFT